MSSVENKGLSEMAKNIFWGVLQTARAFCCVVNLSPGFIQSALTEPDTRQSRQTRSRSRLKN